MQHANIDILCIQETHLLGKTCSKEDGFLYFLSGDTDEDITRSWAGVGFIVGPCAVAAVISFKALFARLATLRLKVVGSVLDIVIVYAPHGRHHFEDRHEFLSELSDSFKTSSNHNATIVLGD